MRKCTAGSNAAEYLALIEGLEALEDLRIGNEPVEVRGDAKCVIDQMLGHAAVSSPLTAHTSSTRPKADATLQIPDLGLGAAPRE